MTADELDETVEDEAPRRSGAFYQQDFPTVTVEHLVEVAPSRRRQIRSLARAFEKRAGKRREAPTHWIRSVRTARAEAARLQAEHDATFGPSLDPVEPEPIDVPAVLSPAARRAAGTTPAPKYPGKRRPS